MLYSNLLNTQILSLKRGLVGMEAILNHYHCIKLQITTRTSQFKQRMCSAAPQAVSEKFILFNFVRSGSKCIAL